MLKNVKGGTLWDSITYIQLQNKKKLEGWPKVFSKKNRTVPKKIQKEDTSGTSGFVDLLEKVEK